MLTIMYHFVSSALDNAVFNGTRGINVEDLENQIVWLINNGYSSLSCNEILSILDNGTSFQKKKFYLTFDDGIKQHSKNVLPLLLKYKIEAAFFIPTKPLIDKVLPVFEKQRILQYSLYKDYSEFLEAFCTSCRTISKKDIFNPTAKNVKNAKDYLGQFSFYDDSERYYRKLRNEFLDNKTFNLIIEQLFSGFYSKDEVFLNEYFLSEKDIRELADNGMVIGGHSHSHPFLTKLAEDEIIEEINISHEFLQSLISREITIFAYPFGDNDTKVQKCLKVMNIRCAFDTRTGADSSRYNLHRHDVKDLQEKGFFN